MIVATSIPESDKPVLFGKDGHNGDWDSVCFRGFQLHLPIYTQGQCSAYISTPSGNIAECIAAIGIEATREAVLVFISKYSAITEEDRQRAADDIVAGKCVDHSRLVRQGIAAKQLDKRRATRLARR